MSLLLVVYLIGVALCVGFTNKGRPLLVSLIIGVLWPLVLAAGIGLAIKLAIKSPRSG